MEIRSRKDKDLTRMYPGVAEAALRVHAARAVIDGEIVALDAQGRPSFQALQHRGSHPHHHIVFYAFDLLHLEGGTQRRLAEHAPRTALRKRIASVSTLPSSSCRGPGPSDIGGGLVLSSSQRLEQVREDIVIERVAGVGHRFLDVGNVAAYDDVDRLIGIAVAKCIDESTYPLDSDWVDDTEAKSRVMTRIF